MMTNLTVLVIEDDEAIQAMLEGMLGMDGYRVRCAYDGLGGLYEVGWGRPDLIILDLGLPLMNGESFIAEYHQTPPPHAPIIGISAYSVEPNTIPGLAAFIKKPFDLAQLRSTMNAVLHSDARV